MVLIMTENGRKLKVYERKDGSQYYNDHGRRQNVQTHLPSLQVLLLAVYNWGVGETLRCIITTMAPSITWIMEDIETYKVTSL